MTPSEFAVGSFRAATYPPITQSNVFSPLVKRMKPVWDHNSAGSCQNLSKIHFFAIIGLIHTWTGAVFRTASRCLPGFHHASNHIPWICKMAWQISQRLPANDLTPGYVLKTSLFFPSLSQNACNHKYIQLKFFAVSDKRKKEVSFAFSPTSELPPPDNFLFDTLPQGLTYG